MELSPFVDRLRSDLADAAAAGGDDTRRIAERLLLALDPATRLVLLEALAQAAAEITGELDHDAVDVRMAGRDPEFVVTRLGGDAGEAAPAGPPAAPPVAPEPAPDDSQSRITLRLPESVKTRAEDAAAGAGVSLNTWLADAVRAALTGTTTGPDHRSGDHPGRRSNRIQGWVS